MYIREKKVRVGGKLYSGYYQIVEGHRDDQGRVRQRVIKYLGKFEGRQQALRAAVKAGYSQALRPAERAAIRATAAEAAVNGFHGAGWHLPSGEALLLRAGA